jgi:hypothetical protein
MEQLGFQWPDFDEIVYLRLFFETVLRKFKFYENPARIAGTLYEGAFTFETLSR